MPVTIHDGSTITVEHFNYPDSRNVLRNPRGLKYYYAFGRRLSIFVGDTHVYKSADGITWSKETDLDVSTHVTTIDMTYYEDSDNDQLVIYLALYRVDAVNEKSQIIYRRGTIADDSSTISWGTEQLLLEGNIAAGGGALPHYMYANIALGVQSGREYVYITYQKKESYKGGNSYSIYVIATTTTFPTASPSWSDEEPVYVPGNQDTYYPTVVPLSATEDILIVFILNPGLPPYDLYGFEMSWDGSDWSTGTTDTVTDATNGYAPSVVVDSGNKAWVLFRYLPFGLYPWTVNSGWGSDVGIYKPESVQDNFFGITIDKSVSPNELYVFWCEGTSDSTIRYVSSPVNSISWSSETTILDNEDEYELYNPSLSARDIEDSLHLVYIQSVGPTDRNARYHEISLAPPAVVAGYSYQDGLVSIVIAG